MEAIAIIWWTLFVAITAFSLGVWIRAKIMRAALMNEIVSIEIAKRKAAMMIEKTAAVTATEYKPKGTLT